MRKKHLILAAAALLALTAVLMSGCSGDLPADGPLPEKEGSEILPSEKEPENLPPLSDGEDDGKGAAFVGHSQEAKPPKEGTPADYNGIENVSFMAYVLSHQAAYRSEAFGTVDTKVGFLSYRQEIETYKDCKDGVMVTVDVSKSSLVNTATQACFLGDRVLRREPASKNAKDWNGRNTRFAEGAPIDTSVEDYRKIYGLPSTDFSVYRLTAETLTEWSEVTDNGDGTYTQTVYPDKKAASADYAARMKTMGGLSSLPVFDHIEITYTFDSSWRVLSSVTREHYGVVLGVLHADNCSATTTQTFDYDASTVDASEYDNYYSHFIGKNEP